MAPFAKMRAVEWATGGTPLGVGAASGVAAALCAILYLARHAKRAS